MMKICRVLLLLLFLLLPVTASAGVWWGNYNGNQDYMDPGNWWSDSLGGFGLPGVGSVWDQASINEGATPGSIAPPIMSGPDISGFWDNLVGFWQSGSMSMSSGTMSVGNAFAVGYGTDGTQDETSTFHMTGGTINAPYFMVGGGDSSGYDNDGTVTMDGGYIWNSLGLNFDSAGLGKASDGALYLNSGWIDAYDWLAMSAGDLIQVGAGGTLKLWGFWQQDATFEAQIDGLIASGLITAAPGLTLQKTLFDNGQGDAWYGNTGIQLNAVPEPATMVLLGLGGLLLRRRK